MEISVRYLMHMVIYYLVVVISFSTISCGNAEKSWEEIKTSDGTKPMKRHECGFVERKGKFYLIGGRGYRPVDIYDPAENKWTQGSQPPLEIHHFQPVVFRDKIVIVGAMTGLYPNELPLPYIISYNPDTDEWFSIDSIPTERLRGSGGTVIYQDKIYWVGGLSEGHMGGHKSFFDEYNPITRKWKKLPDAPRVRDHFQAVVGNDKLYVAGGRMTKAPYGTFTHVITEIDVYDFQTHQWSTLEQELPTPRAGTFTLFHDKKLYISGGESLKSRQAFPITEIYDTQNQSWSALPPMKNGRHGTGMVYFNNCIYVGAGNSSRGGDNELDDLIRLCQ
ncbi:MAG TPA: kelch repeat-containing protein [Saprospiraceae bacterium]|nr:kelch repeat-containing protein [Saprospiraceae bacterium]